MSDKTFDDIYEVYAQLEQDLKELESELVWLKRHVATRRISLDDILRRLDKALEILRR